ncbi:response regulator [Dongshaea marina]|uniref:response regulator n=1 Tax=Dongshaea marina TaxID=2047966 RepID=UPI00131EE3EE|nr:response regulator [Dongshaea marina]
MVDDEPCVLSSLRILLRSLECEVLTANSGEEALDIFRNQSVDFIMSDHRMPGMTGVEFLREVHKLSPQTRRFIMTAYADFESVISGFNDGIIEKLISKPWENNQLIQLIENCIQQSRNRPNANKSPLLRNAFKKYSSNEFHQHYYYVKSLCRIDWELPIWLWSELYWERYEIENTLQEYDMPLTLSPY